MRIVQVVPYFARRRGGDVNVCCSISDGLCRLGEDVTVLTSDYDVDWDLVQWARGRGIEVIPFPSEMNFAMMIWTPAMWTWMKKSLCKGDIIHAHSFRSYQNIIVRNAARRLNIPYVIQAHGSIPHLNNRIALKRAFDTVWGRKILTDASALLALTRTEERQYQTRGARNSRIAIVRNGIDSQEYLSMPLRGEFRKRYGMTDEKVIMYFGRLHRSKGIELLVQSFRTMCDRYPNLRLVVAGPDFGAKNNLVEIVESLGLKEKTIFTGFISESEKRMALMDADVLVVPRYSGFPIIFLESCMCGTPLVTTTEGDELEWICGNIGVVAQYNVASMSDAIMKVLSWPSDKHELRVQRREFVLNEFNWTSILRDLKGIYESVKVSRSGF